ncbi:hypothetical protein GOODEAATRI_010243, partial [Goodea atripinnis]
HGSFLQVNASVQKEGIATEMQVDGFIRQRNNTHPCLLWSSDVGCLRRVPPVSPRAPRRDT